VDRERRHAQPAPPRSQGHRPPLQRGDRSPRALHGGPRRDRARLRRLRRVVGSHRGGVQIAFAAAKLPLAVLFTLAIAVPAFYAIAHAHGREWSFRQTIALTLAAMARASLVLLAVSPLLWVAVDNGLGYHASAVVAALLYLVAGLAALGVLARGLGPGAGRVAATVLVVLVFFAVGGQTTWILRPYLVRPQTAEVPLVRNTEGSFADAVWTSSFSSLGVYRRRWIDKPGAREETPEWLQESRDGY
jgi:hypothetical protein